jgi:hypothetical protein
MQDGATVLMFLSVGKPKKQSASNNPQMLYEFKHNICVIISSTMVSELEN